MTSRASSSHVSAPNLRARLTPDQASDDELIRDFTLSLGASGGKEKTLVTYEESIRMLSRFAHELGLVGLANTDRKVVRHWLMSLHQKGNKPGAISVRYRACNRFFKWCVAEEERPDNPIDRIAPPRIPDAVQPYYAADEVNAVLKANGSGHTQHEFRDKALILTLYDTGVRASELVGMMAEDIDWKERSILVTGKGGKQRRVSIGNQAATARKRQVRSPYLLLASGNKPLSNNGMAMMLRRRFNDAGVQFKGAHAFGRAFAMAYLGKGGALDDLKELGGWEHYAMVSRYARASAGERAVRAHKKFSPADRLLEG